MTRGLFARKTARSGPVKIDGRCSSACTMGLSYPNVCVTPRAQFDFHLAYTTEMLKTKGGFVTLLLPQD